jgi:hypothetical protein
MEEIPGWGSFAIICVFGSTKPRFVYDGYKMWMVNSFGRKLERVASRAADKTVAQLNKPLRSRAHCVWERVTMNLTVEQIDAIRFSKELSAEVASCLDSYKALASNPATESSSELTNEDYDALRDVCLEVLGNEAPTVEEYTAEQDKGAYAVTVRGVPGAYFVQALEYDDKGVFSTLDEARDCAFNHYGEFFVHDDDEEDSE